VGLYIKGVSHGFVQMVYYCLDLFLISLQSCLLHFFMNQLLKKASFPLDKHPAASMVFGAIWALKKPS
jgi:hypothetical protein